MKDYSHPKIKYWFSGCRNNKYKMPQHIWMLKKKIKIKNILCNFIGIIEIKIKRVKQILFLADFICVTVWLD